MIINIKQAKVGGRYIPRWRVDVSARTKSVILTRKGDDFKVRGRLSKADYRLAKEMIERQQKS